MLETVNEMMSSQYGIYDCGVSQSGNVVWRIDFSNTKIVEDVRRWGVTERKTFSTKFPDLPAEFQRDFVRGVFDGDGSVSMYHCNTLGDIPRGKPRGFL